MAGVGLLGKVVYNSANGALALRLFDHLPPSGFVNAWAFGLSVPVPFHVIAVGLILQRRWLSPGWRKVTWYAVVISGCWLAVALGIKALYI